MPRIVPFVLLFPLFGFGQQEKKVTVPDPPYLNVIYCWSADTLTGLERSACQVKNKLRAFGFGGGSSMAYVMDGARSTVRLKAGANMRFAIKLSGMIDPSRMIRLYRFDSQRKTRETLLSGQTGKEQVDFNVQQATSETFVLIPAASLSAGEYAFLNIMQASQSGMTMSYTAYTFGIDP